MNCVEHVIDIGGKSIIEKRNFIMDNSRFINRFGSYTRDIILREMILYSIQLSYNP